MGTAIIRPELDLSKIFGWSWLQLTERDDGWSGSDKSDPHPLKRLISSPWQFAADENSDRPVGGSEAKASMASMAVALSPPSSWTSSSLYAKHTPSPPLFFRSASSLGISSKAPPFSSLSQGWWRRAVSAAATAEGLVVESLDAPDARF